MRRIALCFVALAVLAGGMATQAASPKRADAISVTIVEAHVPPGTAVYGGPGNPCGYLDRNPGVTSLGYARVSGRVTVWNADLDTDLTVNASTRYNAAVATAKQAWWDVMGERIPCDYAKYYENWTVGDALRDVACVIGRGKPRSPKTWCAMAQATPGSLPGLSYPETHVWCGDASSPYGNPWIWRGGTGPYKWAEWNQLHAKIERKTFDLGITLGIDVFMDSIRLDAGLTGAQKAMGRVPSVDNAEWFAGWYVGLVNEANARKVPTLMGYPTTNFTRASAFFGNWIAWHATLFEKDALTSINNMLKFWCTSSAPWVADVVDPGFRVSRIALDNSFRELYDGLARNAPFAKHIPPGADIACRDMGACRSTVNFAKVFFDHWDKYPAWSADPCLTNHGLVALRKYMRKKPGCLPQ